MYFTKAPFFPTQDTPAPTNPIKTESSVP
uniref:Uncharacterized protein n=1 Tax=Arundo donax TaxID=35708 RepID=A0A0A9HT19_ARUDO